MAKFVARWKSVEQRHRAAGARCILRTVKWSDVKQNFFELF